MNRHGHSRTTTFTATCMGPEMGGPHSTQVVTAPPDSIQAENILTSPQLVLEHGFDLNNISLLSFLRNESSTPTYKELFRSSPIFQSLRVCQSLSEKSVSLDQISTFKYIKAPMPSTDQIISITAS